MEEYDENGNAIEMTSEMWKDCGLVDVENEKLKKRNC